MSEEILVAGRCSHCQGKFNFPEHGAGMAVDCPHCGKSTVLKKRLSDSSIKTWKTFWLSCAVTAAVIGCVFAFNSYSEHQAKKREVESLDKRQKIAAIIAEHDAQERDRQFWEHQAEVQAKHQVLLDYIKEKEREEVLDIERAKLAEMQKANYMASVDAINRNNEYHPTTITPMYQPPPYDWRTQMELDNIRHQIWLQNEEQRDRQFWDSRRR
jgi:DNA-directed RNA polymerase subunit RPC12/RpoP